MSTLWDCFFYCGVGIIIILKKSSTVPMYNKFGKNNNNLPLQPLCLKQNSLTLWAKEHSSFRRMVISHLAVKYKSNYNYTYDILELRKVSFSMEHFAFTCKRKLMFSSVLFRSRTTVAVRLNIEHSSGFYIHCLSLFLYAFSPVQGYYCTKIYRIFLLVIFFVFVKFHTFTLHLQDIH